jgi:hypothetical protein
VSDIRVCVYGSVSVCWEWKVEILYVLHVISLDENIRLSFVGISAREARVAVEVVYHHTFLVFGQRSVHDRQIKVKTNFHSVQTGSHTADLWGGKGRRERECEVFLFLDGTVSEVTIPVHQRTFVYSLSAVSHQRIVSSRSRLVDPLRLQRQQVGRNSYGRANR